jgi:hypothetical protein
VCEQRTRSSPARISLVDCDTGAAETMVDGWGGLPLNSRHPRWGVADDGSESDGWPHTAVAGEGVKLVVVASAPKAVGATTSTTAHEVARAAAA